MIKRSAMDESGGVFTVGVAMPEDEVARCFVQHDPDAKERFRIAHGEVGERFRINPHFQEVMLDGGPGPRWLVVQISVYDENPFPDREWTQRPIKDPAEQMN